ncbi:MAG: cupin domain-containing protein [Tumebacillaceae bacterium]
MLKKQQLINLTELAGTVQDEYKNFVVNDVNESCLRMAVFQGVYEWHFHPDCDELFLVLEGELCIDFQDGSTVVIHPQEVFTVPAGVVHRTRAEVRTVNLCFEHANAETVFVEM